MTQDSKTHGLFRVSDLSPRNPPTFEITPNESELAILASELGLLGLRKLRFKGSLEPEGTTDWALTAQFGATVVQPCVVTLQPVTTRIEERVKRRFLRDWPTAEELGEDVEMPDDETIDALEETINLKEIMAEVLALSLPPYPRVQDAKVENTRAAPPGTAPLDDDAVKPFAALAGLRDKLESDD